jgi:hypothetical protein
MIYLYDIFDLIYTHIFEVLPFFIGFQLLYSVILKRFFDFNTSYFLLHLIVNIINTYFILPFVIKMIYDPLGKYFPLDNWEHLEYIYPMVIGLHTFHLKYHIKNIYYDELIHHFLTHVFWYITYINNDPMFIMPMIIMSGIPGGITYLLLFLQKLNKISKMTEKKISMYINIWIRAPFCIIFSTIMYIKTIQPEFVENYWFNIFMIYFTMKNGIHFMYTITKSYYENIFKNVEKHKVKDE